MFKRIFGLESKEEKAARLEEEAARLAKEKAVEKFNKKYRDYHNEEYIHFYPRETRSLDGFKEENFLPKNFLYEDKENIKRNFVNVSKFISLSDLEQLSSITLEEYEKNKHDIDGKLRLLVGGIKPTQQERMHLEASLISPIL